MMEQKNILDVLRSSIQAAPEIQPLDYNDALIKHAAVRVSFDQLEMDSWKKQLAASSNWPSHDTEDLFRSTGSTSTVKYYMKDGVRNDVLKAVKAKDELMQLVQSLPEKSDDPTQHLLKAYILGNAPSLEQQSAEERLSTYNISQWLQGTVFEVPKPLDVLQSIKQDEALLPLRRLTTNFKGRDKELRILSDYVDWLPKESLLSKALDVVRRIGNWNDKPPLLITGIGGAGKSTLMAKFILNQVENTERGRLPFINLDFDKPGVSVLDPITIVYEALRQLIQQYPSFDYLKKLREEIRRMYSEGSSERISRASDRAVWYEEYFNRPEVEKFISSLNIPILLVFDSFEEVQTRFSQTEMESFFNFLEEMTGCLPRLRIVFISRSDYITSQRKFERLNVGDFDEGAAVAFLLTLGISSENTARQLFKQFKGNPLTLRLVGDLLHKERLNNRGQIDDVQTSGWFTQIQESRIQEQLVKRNLDHIRNPEVRQIAFPGLVVRQINPEVIQKVLAGPCGLGEISSEKSDELFLKLQQESFLLAEVEGGIAFRQDLRVALYDLVLQQNPEQVNAIHRNAIEHYRWESRSERKAEYIYHALMNGEEPQNVLAQYDYEVGKYLNNSLIELPLNAHILLASLIGTTVPEEKLATASEPVWAAYYSQEISRSLITSDFLPLKKLYDRVRHRAIESRERRLLLAFAKLTERVGDVLVLENILEGPLSNAYNLNLTPSRLSDKANIEEGFIYNQLVLDFCDYFGESKSNRALNYAFSSMLNDSVLTNQLGVLYQAWEREFYDMPGDLEDSLTRNWVHLCMSALRYGKKYDRPAVVVVLQLLYNTKKTFEASYESRLTSGYADRARMYASFSSFFPKYMTMAVKSFQKTLKFDLDLFELLLVYASRRNPRNEELFSQNPNDYLDHRLLERQLMSYGNVRLKDMCDPGSPSVNRVDVMNFVDVIHALQDLTAGKERSGGLK